MPLLVWLPVKSQIFRISRPSYLTYPYTNLVLPCQSHILTSTPVNHIHTYTSTVPLLVWLPVKSQIFPSLRPSLLSPQVMITHPINTIHTPYQYHSHIPAQANVYPRIHSITHKSALAHITIHTCNKHTYNNILTCNTRTQYTQI